MIGIVGGMGPKAGEHLHSKILSNTRASSDFDHLQIVLFTNPALPDRGPFIFGEHQDNPAQEIVRSLLLLHQMGATVLCVPCNTAHSACIWDVVEAGMRESAPDAVLLHIIRVTVDYIVHHHPTVARVGILGTTYTIACELYQRELASHNIQPIVPNETNQRRVQDSIYHPQWGMKAKSDPVTKEATEAIAAASLRMIADGAELVILGCTELGLALPQSDLKGTPLVDSNIILARECIRQAAGNAKLTSKVN
jgi:aspartate racemase